MSGKAPRLTMPPAREFGWTLKPESSSHFAIHQRDGGQFCVVLNHALLRGVTAEMIYWWFERFTLLKVLLPDTPGYEGKVVPAYQLWHPIDHYDAHLSGPVASDGRPRVGASIHIQEAMQYDVHGWRFPVDTKVKIYYVAPDGWAMGKVLPLMGPVMMLRIHFRDVEEAGVHVGVHYHYEVVIGVSGRGPVARRINRSIGSSYGPEFFAAWHRHNVIEVGTFENFLPALYKQRAQLDTLEYGLDMNPKLSDPATQAGFDRALFEQRLAGFEASKDPFEYQAYAQSSYL